MTDFIGTTGTDNFVGGSGNDFFIFAPSLFQATDRISGGGGINALGLVNDLYSDWAISSNQWLGAAKIHGIVLYSEGGGTVLTRVGSSLPSTTVSTRLTKFSTL